MSIRRVNLNTMSQLEIKHLKMICSIARTGNMTKAAETLFISQSALSQQLKDIEGKLNVDLFFRTRKKMTLTPTGKELLQAAENIIETLEGAELEIARRVSGESGEFKVGTQCLFCYKWLPGVLARFQEKFPNIEFEIGASIEPERELEEKRYDVVIGTAVNQKADETLSTHPLFEDQMVCIMSNDNPLATHHYINLEDFEEFCLISHAEKSSNRFYLTILKPRAIEPKKFMTIAQPQAIIEMVASGFGISAVPRWAVRSALESNQISALPITRKGFPLTWNAISLKNSSVPVFQREFINIVGRMNPSDAHSISPAANDIT